MHSIKEKIEWLLNDGFLMDSGKANYAYALDQDTHTFYAIDFKRVGETKPVRYFETTALPLKDIAEKMDILVEY